MIIHRISPHALPFVSVTSRPRPAPPDIQLSYETNPLGASASTASAARAGRGEAGGPCRSYQQLIRGCSATFSGCCRRHSNTSLSTDSMRATRSSLLRERLRDAQGNRLRIRERNTGHHSDGEPALGERHQVRRGTDERPLAAMARHPRGLARFATPINFALQSYWRQRRQCGRRPL